MIAINTTNTIFYNSRRERTSLRNKPLLLFTASIASLSMEESKSDDEDEMLFFLHSTCSTHNSSHLRSIASKRPRLSSFHFSRSAFDAFFCNDGDVFSLRAPFCALLLLSYTVKRSKAFGQFGMETTFFSSNCSCNFSLNISPSVSPFAPSPTCNTQSPL